MQSSIDFDVSKFKAALEEPLTDTYGWEQAFDGTVENHADCSLKVYKKKAEGESIVTTCSVGVFKNVKAENFFKMISDVGIMAKEGGIFKKIEVLEKPSKNSDIVYIEIDLPFPLSNRDLVVKRVYLSSTDDADLIRELGLTTLDHKYYIIMQQSVTRADCPEKKGIVRAESKLGLWLIEEDPTDKSVTRIKSLACQNFNGNIPTSVINKMSVQGAPKRLGKTLDNYAKLYGM